MSSKQSVSYKSFSVFADDFERYCRTSKNIMDVPLMYLIAKAFGYETVTLSRYQNARFRGLEVVGALDAPAIKEHYLRSFQKRDPFAAYIGRACAQNPGVATLKSSAVFESNYFYSEYYHFLRNYGLSWALSLPIGEYRLTLYKHADEPDFNQEEHDALEYLGTLIRARHQTHSDLAAQLLSQEVQSQLLDSMDIGFVSVDGELRVKSCNNMATEYLSTAGGSLDMDLAVDAVISLLKQQGTRKFGSHPAVWMEHQGRTVLMEAIRGSGQDEMCYTLTIYPQNRAEGGSTCEKIMRQYGLTMRELEVSRLLISGKSYQETADALYISINTVRTHVKNVYKKIGISNQRMLGVLLR